MDQPELERRLDQIVEDEVRASFKDVDLPAELQAILRKDREADPSLPLITRLRLYKLNARKKRLVQDALMDRYHADLKNEAILSTAQLRELNIKRGEWSVEQERKMSDLSDETNRLSQELYHDGLNKDKLLSGRLTELCVDYRLKVEGDLDNTPRVPEAQRQGVLQAFNRWLEWEMARQAEFDAAFAADQGREVYSPDADLQFLLDAVPGVDAYDVLVEIQDLRDKLQGFVELLEKRSQLRELQVRHAKIFAESVEQRRDTTEEMARVFYCCAWDSKGQWVPLGKTHEDVWNLPDEVIEWLLVEVYLFLNGIPDAAREYLEAMGFIAAPRRSGSATASAGSPAEPTSNAGLPLSPVTVQGSSSGTPQPVMS